jgi:site-specific DNA recombinase
MRAAIYARISLDRTGEALGVERQIKDATKLVDGHGWTLAGTHVDNDISALSGKRRPGYESLMAAVRDGQVDVIVVYMTSRLWRNRKERAEAIELLKNHGVSVHSVKGPILDAASASGRMMLGILGEFDTGESEIKSERVMRANDQKAERGLAHGGRRPFGYSAGGMEVDEREAAELRNIYGRLLAGVPVSGIVRELNERGVLTSSGKAWGRTSLRDMLVRPRNAGLREHRGVVVGPAAWPAIVPEETWRAACAIIADPTRRTSTGNRASYLLSGIATCGQCGGSMTSANVGSKIDGPRRVYRCRANACVARRRDWIDQLIEDVVIERLSRPDARDLLVDETRPDFDQLRNAAIDLRTRLEDAAAAFAEGEIMRLQLQVITKRLTAQLEDVERQQGHTDRANILADVVTATDVRAAWKAAGLDRQRAIVQVLMTVAILPGGGGSRLFDPTKVRIDWKN